MADEVGQPDSVARKASRAFGWSFGNTLASRLGTLAIGVALARILGPDEFGVFAIATVTLLAILSFNELGVSLAVIRWREDPAKIAPTINTVSVVSSAVLMSALIIAAPWLATALGDVEATPVVQVMAVSVLINGLVATPAAILQREFMQKERTIADQVNTWLGAGLSIVLALFGWGAMSLAVGRVVASIVFAILLWRWSPVPYRFGWDRTLIGRLMRFGLPLAASSVVLFAASYADQIIIGATLGAQALGFYVLAFNLASWPLTIFSMPLRAVAPAAFSAIKHDSPRMSRNYARIFALLMSVALPACLAISGASDPVIRFVYGAAWSDSGPILMWLALLIAFKIGFELAYDYLVVLGKSGWIFATQAVSLVTAVPAMLLAASPFGAPGVAAAQVAVAAVILMPIYAAQLHRMGVRVATSVRAVLLPTCVGIVVWVASRLFAESVPIAFVAAALAALVSVLGIAVAVYPRRDTVRLFRSSMSGGGAS